MKSVYHSPSVLREVTVLLENSLLAESVVNKNTDIQTTGQKVQSVDFSAPTFNHQWE